jgi:Holliday junction resolvase RusA-like endonuclease
MTPEEIKRALARQYGITVDAHGVAKLLNAQPPRQATNSPRGTVTLPLRFTLPWSALVSDNRKYTAAYTSTNRPKLILTPQYRDAKKKARDIVQAIIGNASPVSIPLSLHAKVWVPDNRPGHDVANFAKCCHDALEEVIYTKDEWLHKITWERAGVSVDAPHVSIEIRAL